MFNKKPDKAMYFPESLFFAKDNIYGHNAKLFTLDEAKKKFEKSNQYSLLEIEKEFGKKYDNFNNDDLEVFNSKFKYCSIGILSKNKDIIKLLSKLITDSNWKRSSWYTSSVEGDFYYDHFSYDGFSIKRFKPLEKIYWLETNRLKGDYNGVKDTLIDLGLNVDFEQINKMLGTSKGISIKFQIIERVITKLITIRYCTELINGLSEIRSVTLNAEKFKNFVRHLYKEAADRRMAIYQYDNRCMTKEEYLKFNGNQVGVGFTWYILNKALHELTLEHYEDSLLKRIFRVKAKNIEEEIKIIFPMITECYSNMNEKMKDKLPIVREKRYDELWYADVTIDFGFEIIGNFNSHRDVYHFLTYVMICLINKYEVQGNYVYRSTVNGNTSRVGIEKNY